MGDRHTDFEHSFRAQALINRVTSFLTSNAALFGLDSPTSDLKLIEYIDEDTGLAPVPYSVKPKQRVRIRFERLIGGYPVFGSRLRIGTYYDRDISAPMIGSVLSNFLRRKTITNAVILSPQQAITKALAGTTAAHPTVESVVFNFGLDPRGEQCQGPNRFAYKVTLTPSDQFRCDPVCSILNERADAFNRIVRTPRSPESNPSIMLPQTNPLRIWNLPALLLATIRARALGCFKGTYAGYGARRPGSAVQVRPSDDSLEAVNQHACAA